MSQASTYASKEWTKSRYLVAVAIPDPASPGSRVMVYSTRSGQIREMNALAWDNLDSQPDKWLTAEELQDLIDAHILVPVSEDELDTILNENDDAAAQSDELYFVIQPTASCQLGCDYCGQRHTSKVLSVEDQNHIVAQLERKLSRGTFQALKISWFGAEPLLGLKAMRQLSPLLVDLASRHGCQYSAEVVTNGVLLTREVSEELIALHKVKYVEVTLDGSAEYHDTRRHWKRTHATSFDTIYDNLRKTLECASTELQVGLRCNVDSNNRLGVSPLLKQLVQDGLHEKLAGVYFAPIHSWGNDADEVSLDEATFASEEIRWLAEMHSLGFTVKVLPKRKKVVCMAVQPEAELVDAYGNIFDCTEVSYVPAYELEDKKDSILPIVDSTAHVGANSYTIGHVSDLSPRQRTHLISFSDNVRRLEFPCSSCEMLPVCGGQCPKLWHEGKACCPSAKHNIEQRLLLHRGMMLGYDILLDQAQV